MPKRKVVLITDGDSIAQSSVEAVARNVGGRCISLSGGNPTPLTGPEIVELIKKTPFDPVLVMVDDKGKSSQGKGEQAMEYIAKHPDIQVLGVVAVASNTHHAKGTLVDFSITNNGEVVDAPVDKEGNPENYKEYLKGDTVDVLRKLNIPVIVGVGDIGKQDGADVFQDVTTAAVEKILGKGVYHNGSDQRQSRSQQQPGAKFRLDEPGIRY